MLITFMVPNCKPFDLEFEILPAVGQDIIIGGGGFIPPDLYVVHSVALRIKQDGDAIDADTPIVHLLQKRLDVSSGLVRDIEALA